MCFTVSGFGLGPTDVIFHLLTRFVQNYLHLYLQFQNNLQRLNSLLKVVLPKPNFQNITLDLVSYVNYRENPVLSEPLLPTINSISLSNFFDFTKRVVFTIHGHDDSISGNFNAFVVPGELFHTIHPFLSTAKQQCFHNYILI